MVNTLQFRSAVLLAVLLLLANSVVMQLVHAIHASVPLRWHGRDLVVSGRIATPPVTRTDVTRFDLSVDHLMHRPWPYRLQLSWYHPRLGLHLGQHCHGIVRLKPVHRLLNPQDSPWFRAWAYFYYAGRGYIYRNQWYCDAASPSLHQRLLDAVQRRLAHNPMQGMITALSLGQQHWITHKQWRVLQRTGTSHLMAISGLHLSLVAVFVFIAVGGLWRLSEHACLWQPAPRVAAWAALAMMFWYAWLCGFSVPLKRALIMNACVLLSYLLAINWPISWRLLLAALIVTLLQPIDLFARGFWLSFTVVCIIVVACRYIDVQRKVHAFFLLQAIITVMIVPISLYAFHGVTTVGFFANAIAIPWVSFVVLPLCLLSTMCVSLHLSGAALGYNWAAVCLQWLWWLLRYLAHWSWSFWYGSPASVFICVVLALVLALLLLPWLGRWRWLMVLPAVSLLCWHQSPPPVGQLRLTMLDVGQGLAIVVQTHHHALVYDTGASRIDGFNAGRQVVMPFLRYRGIVKLDRIVISHADNDHIGGLSAILSALPVAEVMMSRRDSRVALPAVTHFGLCRTGKHWRWDGVDFEVLYPPQGLRGGRNNLSCVLRMSVSNQVVLLTGDIEAKAERWLLQHQREQLAAAVLQVPHHGSRTSSTLKFVKAVKPSLALVGAGFLNRYGLPVREVVLRYDQNGSNVLNAASIGAIEIAGPKC